MNNLEFNSSIKTDIKKANSSKNPKFESNKKNGYSNWKIPAIIETYKYCSDGYLLVPRGFFSELLKLCNNFETKPVIPRSAVIEYFRSNLNNGVDSNQND